MKRYVVITECKPSTFESWKQDERMVHSFCQFDDLEEARKVAKVMQNRTPESRFLICEAIERTSPPPVELESLREPTA